MRRFAIAALLAAGMLAAGPTVHAKTLRWSSQGDILTMDPHAQNEGLNNTVVGPRLRAAGHARQGPEDRALPRDLVEGREPDRHGSSSCARA